MGTAGFGDNTLEAIVVNQDNLVNNLVGLPIAHGPHRVHRLLSRRMERPVLAFEPNTPKESGSFGSSRCGHYVCDL